MQEVRSSIIEAARDATTTASRPRSRVPADVTKVYAEWLDVHSWEGRTRIGDLQGGMLPTRGPYEDIDGTPLVARSVVMVLDRLGSSQAMSKGITTNDLVAERQLMARTIDWLHDEHLSDFQTLATYTDNLVHAVPVDPHDPAMQLGFTMIGAAHYQLALATENQLLRGGIVIGDHHTSEGLISGPALIQAHHLQADLAVHPRVLLSREAAWTALTSVLRDEARPADSPMGALLRVDGDGHVFLNYLAIIEDYGDRRSQNATLRRHQKAIRRNLDRYENEPRPLSKWQWTAQYHNYFITDTDRAASLRITEDETGLDDWAFGRTFRSIFDDQNVVAALSEAIESARQR